MNAIQRAADRTSGDHPIDVLLVLGHVIIVRNFVADGLLGALIRRGLKVAVVAPDDTLPFIRALAPGLVALHPLSRFRPSRFRIKTLQRLRIGSFLARQQSAAYRLKLAYGQKVSLERRVTIAFWKAVARSTDPEALAMRWANGLRPRRSAIALIQSTRPRLLVWPTTISDPADFEIVQAAAHLKYPLLMCEGSWDNLVTKGAIWPRPDRLLVWGEFSRQHAIEDHRFAPHDVTVTGPPHFGVYARPEDRMPRREWFAEHGLDPSRRLILVAGSTIGRVVEPQLVQAISRLIDNGTLPPSYVWYRPHPKVGKRFDTSQLVGDPNVRLDPTLEEADDELGMSRLIHSREAEQRADGLAASDLVVSMFSTVVLEGALLGKPALLVDLRTLKGVSGRPTTAFQGVAHVQQILQTPWIRLAPSLEALGPLLKEFLEMDSAAIQEPLRAFAQQIASCGPRSPHDRTIEAMTSLLESGLQDEPRESWQQARVVSR